MSTSEIERFVSDMEGNAALRTEAEKFVQSSEAPLVGLATFARGKGYAFTADHLGQSIGPVGKTLSQGELDNVAGGGWNLWRSPPLFPLALLLGFKG